MNHKYIYILIAGLISHGSFADMDVTDRLGAESQQVGAAEEIKNAETASFPQCDPVALMRNQGKCKIAFKLQLQSFPTPVFELREYLASPEVAGPFQASPIYQPPHEGLTLAVHDGEVLIVKDKFDNVIARKIDFSR
jgi:hypothetical protein